MKYRGAFLIPVSLILLSACEKTLEFNDEITDPKLTIGALANTDTTFMVYLYQSAFFLDVQSFTLAPFDLPSQATVQLSVNGAAFYNIPLDVSENIFISDYRPSINDRLSLTVSCEGFETITTQTTVVERPLFEIIDHYIFYSKSPEKMMSDGLMHPIDFWGTDSVMNISCRITDPGNMKNFYRLSVRSIGSGKEIPLGADDWALAKDIFSSDDILFIDKNVSTSINGWPEHFSNVFDDSLFDGKEYSFTVESRQRDAEYTWVEIELQHVSEDFYKYLKSIELAQCSANDIYAEPVNIFSNVENGYGILGSLSGSKYCILF